MARTYRCETCLRERSTLTERGRLPKVCPSCRGAGGYQLAGERPPDPPPDPPVPASMLTPGWFPDDDPDPSDKHSRLSPPAPRTPFNSVPERTAPAVESDGAGPVELKLLADLAMLTQRSPVADTLRELALMLARSADALPPGKVRDLIAASKELRAILEDITKAGGGESDDSNADSEASGGPFGPVRAEISDT